MKNKYYSYFLILVLSLFSWHTNAQVVIGIGTTTDQGLPVEPYFGYTYSQSIYLSSEINASGNITSLKYYTNAGASITSSNDWTIYMGHTTKSSYADNTDWIDVATLTQVFTGTVSVVADEVTITLTVPFAYNGTDNLVIAVDENAAGYNGSTDDFLASPLGTDRSIVYRNDSTDPDPTSPPTASSLPDYVANVELGGITQACPDPTALTATNITATTADLGWTENGSATTWNIEYGTAGFTPTGTPTVSGTATNPHNLTGLSSNTDYEFYVQADCGGSGTSSWIGPFAFTTPCGIFTPAYNEDFSAYVPACWEEAQGALSPAAALTMGSSAWTGDGFANSGTTGAARMNVYTTGQFEWLISPSIDLTGGPFQLEYDVALTDYNNGDATTMDADDSLAVVISTDNGATWSSANILAAYTAGSEPSNTGDHIVIDLSAYTGVVKIGFYATSTANLTVDNDVTIDNFSVIAIPACPAVTALTATNITSTSADLGWTENGSATLWNIEYGAAGFTPTGTPTVTGTTTNPHNISGLTPNTAYEFYVQADCGGSGTATWVGPFTFTTECATLVAPWAEPFATDALPACWSESGDNAWEYGSSVTTPAGFAGWGAENVPDHTFGGGGTFIGMDGSDNGNGEVSVLLSPMIDVSGLTNGQLSYWLYSNNTDDAALNKVIVDVYDGAAWVQVDSIQQNLGANWVEFTTALSTLTITGDVQVRFTVTGDNSMGGNTYTNDILIDDVSFDEIPACPAISFITAANVTATSLDLGWTENGSATAWNIEYGAAGFTPTGTPTETGVTTNPFTVNGLSAQTAYDFYVQADCGGSGTATWVGPFSVTTSCAIYTPTYTEDFATYVPNCWEEAEGALSPSATLTPGSSDWIADGFGNNGTTGAARMNIYTTGQNEWLISPSIDLAGGPFQLEYDVALTDYAATVASTMDADDSLAVVISTDNGATWSSANILAAYTAGSEPSNTGDHVVIDLSAYSGVVKFGFYAVSTADMTVDNDVFIDNFLVTDLCVPTTGTDVQTACDSYTWIDGNTYTASNNTATHVLTNAAGCDSTVTLNLTITNSTSSIDVQSACDSYTWIDGNTYTASNNTATHVLTNAAGCDSTVTLNLTINSNSSTDVQTACGSFTWIDGNTYTASNNTATHVLTNAAGCDSTVTLDLTISTSTTGTDVQSACDSYTWIDGNTYTASNNTATHVLTNAAGCDSTVTLNLTITNSTSSTDVQSACDSYTWIDGNTYTASNNTATHVLTNAAGCDSTVTLDLTITTSTSSTDVQTACESFTWIDGNTYTSSNNTATFTLTNAAGCDSIVTLDLTINTVDVSVTNNDPSLTANATGATYQWLDCNNGNAAIAGATDQTFTATANGDYAVEVTMNGCTDTSACVTVSTVSLEQLSIFDQVSVYPNPVSSTVNVDLGDLENVKIQLVDLSGKVLMTQENVSEMYTFDMEQAPGVYFIEVSTEATMKQFKLIKQ